MKAPYRTANEVLADRVQWTLAKLDELVQRGRAERWIEGDATPIAIASDTIAADIAARIAVTPSGVARLEWLAGRLGIESRCRDLLWLLACVELSPAAARLSLLLGTQHCPDLTIPLVRQLVDVSHAEIDVLSRHEGMGKMVSGC